MSLVNVEITGNSNVGGIAGYIDNQSSITESSSRGLVTGVSNVGGLVGNQTGESLVSNCYSRALVSGNRDNVGGLIGNNNSGNVLRCFSIGNVSATQDDPIIGGLIGFSRSGTVTSSFWNTQTSGQQTSAGGIGRTTEQMTYPYDEDTYIGWNFTNIWKADINSDINSGYPFLKTQIRPYPNNADNPNPASESVDVPVSLDRLSWEYIVDSMVENPIGFRIYMNDTGEFDSDTTYTWVEYIEGQTEYHCTAIITDPLEVDTLYYWRVIPTTNEQGIYGDGDAINCPVWSFRTISHSSTDELLPELITELKNNYPNPFNPETTIIFAIEAETDATISIYNIRGQLVKTLHNGSIKAGEHRLIWNGKDNNGREVGSGVYLYRLKTENYDKVKKMLLVK